MIPPKQPLQGSGLAIGDPVSYGLWDGRQIPVTVAKLDAKGFPSVLRVSKTIPGLCKEGARITLDPSFWDAFKG